jgi:hypothetical protein
MQLHPSLPQDDIAYRFSRLTPNSKSASRSIAFLTMAIFIDKGVGFIVSTAIAPSA